MIGRSKFVTWLNNPISVKTKRIYPIIYVIWLISIIHIILPNGTSTSLYYLNLPLNASVQEIRNAFGQGDAGSLLEVALTWARFENLSMDQRWIIHLWTPGLPILEVFLIWISSWIPFLFSYITLLVLVWFGFFILLGKNVRTNRGLLIYLSLISLWISSWDAEYIFRENILYSEGFAFGLLMIGLTLLLHHKPNLYLSGIIIGASIMIRHTTDVANYLLIFVLLFTLPKWFALKRKASKTSQKNLRKTLVNIADRYRKINHEIVYFLLGVLSVTGIWRFIISPYFYQGSLLSLSSTTGYVSRIIWAKDPGIWVGYGLNWPCQLDATLCDNVILEGKNSWSSSKLIFAAILTALRNPIEYLNIKFRIGFAHWAGDNQQFINTNSIATYLLLLVVIISLIGLVITILKFTEASIFEIISLALIIGYLLPMTISHFESRYFMPIRLVAILHVIVISDSSINKYQEVWRRVSILFHKYPK